MAAAAPCVPPWRRGGARAACAIVWAVVGSGCAARLFVPPSGPGAAAPGAAAALASATAACRSVNALVFRIGMKGRVGDQGIPRGGRFDGAVARTGEFFLEASYLGSQRLVLAGRAEEATLWLKDGNRVLHAPLGDLVDLLTGFRLAAPAWLGIIAGCGVENPMVDEAVSYGATIRVTSGEAVLFLEPATSGWRVRWASLGDLHVDYGSSDGVWPRDITLYSGPGAAVPSRIEVTVRERHADPPATDTARAWAFVAPPGAVSMTLEELRTAVWRRQP